MINLDFIDGIAKSLSDAIPSNLQAMKKDLDRNFRAILQNAFANLNLVTRDELDAQTGVLLKTRAKLEALEIQVAQLEKKIVEHEEKKPGQKDKKAAKS